MVITITRHGVTFTRRDALVSRSIWVAWPFTHRARRRASHIHR